MSFKDVRIVDLTRVISGPFCTALLADLGADVIKVESKGQGDPVREQGVMVGGMSSYFANYNRNKRSIALDFYSPEGKQVLADLLAKADVLVENFRPDVLGKMGFTPDRLKAINPTLIHCNINGFGIDGPYADRPAFDFIVQAMSGFMSCNGKAEEPPMRSGVPIADLVCGLYAALGIAAALHGRDKRAEGSTLSVSMLASLMSMLSFHGTNFLNSGVAAPRTGNDHALVAPYGLFATADGEIAIAPSNEAVYQKLVKTLGLEKLLTDPAFATNEARTARRPEINALIEARTREASTEHWIEVLNKAGIPSGPVYGLDRAFDDPQVRSQGIVVETTRPGEVPLLILGSPIRGGDMEPGPGLPPPTLGEHTEALLREAGYDADRIGGLRTTGVI
ncbi:CoA-transferase family III family protein 33 [Mesorhizobium plurifarium]|uniref:CoA-transferase family III family protein 33 n=1 Tax=Mesorhizobium plurifarium TaxID=69974 RepID=A0A0K2W0W2_MESPL|nr:CoA-transferase family III family protein 33 [Mesorhizobium plurifarium]